MFLLQPGFIKDYYLILQIKNFVSKTFLVEKEYLYNYDKLIITISHKEHVYFRYAVATKDIPVGSTLLVEQPVTWSLHPDRYTYHHSVDNKILTGDMHHHSADNKVLTGGILYVTIRWVTSSCQVTHVTPLCLTRS